MVHIDSNGIMRNDCLKDIGYGLDTSESNIKLINALTEMASASKLRNFEFNARERIDNYCKPGWENHVASCCDDSSTFLVASTFIMGSIVGSKTINIEDITFKFVLVGLLDNLINTETRAQKNFRYLELLCEYKDNYISIIEESSDIDMEFLTDTMKHLSKIMYETGLYWDFLILYVGLFNSILLRGIYAQRFIGDIYDSIKEGVYITSKNVIIEDVICIDKSNLKIRCYQLLNQNLNLLSDGNGKDLEKHGYDLLVSTPMIFTAAIIMAFLKSETQYEPISTYLYDLV